MFTIGKIAISAPCILAPLAGISDLPFRMLNRSFGCGFAFGEMISARALVYENRKTFRILSSSPEDRPLGLQLLGDDPEVLRMAVDVLQRQQFDLLDFNAACPVGKVTRKGEGAGLLKEPRRLRALLRVLVDHSPLPVTVKIRAGWDESSVNARDVALHAREAGIQGLFIHGRTKAQGYSGAVNYEVIREVKEALDIPVIASGDGLSPVLIKKMFDETGCDGVAVARGALGNPWIFRQTEEFFRSGTVPEGPGVAEIASTMRTHLHACCEFYGDSLGTIIFRKFFAWYVRGMRGTKKLREKAFRSKTEEEMTGVIGEVLL